MTFAFSPFVPWWALGALAVLLALVAGVAIWRGIRGAWFRALAAAALLAAIANPVMLQEQRDRLSTIVPVVVDRSQSQQTPNVPA